jgi:hypothetical protein
MCQDVAMPPSYQKTKSQGTRIRRGQTAEKVENKTGEKLVPQNLPQRYRGPTTSIIRHFAFRPRKLTRWRMGAPWLGPCCGWKWHFRTDERGVHCDWRRRFGAESPTLDLIVGPLIPKVGESGLSSESGFVDLRKNKFHFCIATPPK